MVIIRNSFPFSYIQVLTGFAFFTFKVVTEENTETDIYS